jgi:hypothetical protein
VDGKLAPVESARFPRGHHHESTGLKLRVRSNAMLGSGTTSVTIPYTAPLRSPLRSSTAQRQLQPETTESSNLGLKNGSIATRKIFNKPVPQLKRTPMKRACTMDTYGKTRKKPSHVVIDTSDDEGSDGGNHRKKPPVTVIDETDDEDSEYNDESE